MAVIRERRRSDGTVSYQVQVRLKGYPPQTSTFQRKTDARKWAEDAASAIRQGRSFASVQAKRHTAAEMIDRYIAEVLPTKPSTRPDLRQHLLWWKSKIGEYYVADVSPSVIGELRDKLLAETTVRGRQRAPATVLRIMAGLSSVFTTAIREWGWLDTSPMTRVSKPRPSRGRVRYLSDEERKKLLEACAQSSNPYLLTVVLVAISTGMRLGEIMSLQWSHLMISSERKIGHAMLLKTKNGDRRGVPIAGAALAALRRMQDQHALDRGIDTTSLKGLVFQSIKLSRSVAMDIRTPWETAVAKAGLKDFRFHDLRHTAASYLAMNGATPSEIADVLGHRTLHMVKRYAHLSDSHIAGVVSRMNQMMLSDKKSSSVAPFEKEQEAAGHHKAVSQ
jgi:integrase